MHRLGRLFGFAVLTDFAVIFLPCAPFFVLLFSLHLSKVSNVLLLPFCLLKKMIITPLAVVWLFCWVNSKSGHLPSNLTRCRNSNSAAQRALPFDHKNIGKFRFAKTHSNRIRPKVTQIYKRTQWHANTWANVSFTATNRCL